MYIASKSGGSKNVTPHQSTSLTAVSAPASVVAKRVMANHSATLKGKVISTTTVKINFYHFFFIAFSKISTVSADIFSVACV